MSMQLIFNFTCSFLSCYINTRPWWVSYTRYTYEFLCLMKAERQLLLFPWLQFVRHNKTTWGWSEHTCKWLTGMQHTECQLLKNQTKKQKKERIPLTQAHKRMKNVFFKIKDFALLLWATHIMGFSDIWYLFKPTHALHPHPTPYYLFKSNCYKFKTFNIIPGFHPFVIYKMNRHVTCVTSVFSLQKYILIWRALREHQRPWGQETIWNCL